MTCVGRLLTCWRSLDEPLSTLGWNCPDHHHSSGSRRHRLVVLVCLCSRGRILLKVIPDWAYWIAIGVLTAAVGAQQVRVANAHTELAQEKSARAIETQQRTQLALDHSETLRLKERQHAAATQQKDEAHAAELLAAKTAGAADRADAQRMRNKLAAFTSATTRPGETDAAACQRVKDRLPRVGALLAEGIELEAESRELIRQRDAEVTLLLGQIKTDRAACSPPD